MHTTRVHPPEECLLSALSPTYEIAHKITFLNQHTNSFLEIACLVDDMNIHFENLLQSLTKQTLVTLCLYKHVQVINKPTHK